MGKIQRQPAVKLICGFIYSDEQAYAKAKASIERPYGAADFESSPIPFTFTKYYAPEMGENLTRRFASFPRTILPDELAPIKVLTNKIEEKLCVAGKRRVNIDPGYVDLAKLVLASTKDFRHRNYLRFGIFTEVTLFWQGKSFKPWEWTFPDYATPEYIAIFNLIRERYARQARG